MGKRINKLGGNAPTNAAGADLVPFYQSSSGLDKHTTLTQAVAAAGGGGGGTGTNLTTTASTTTVTVNSDTGSDAIITAAGTNAGLLLPAEKTKLTAITGTNTGDQTISLTGDITGSGTGSFATSIAAGVIVNADVNASAGIALTKLATGTVSRASVTDALGFLTTATTTSTEIGYVSGVTSAIQTQLNAKAPLASPALTGTPAAPTATNGTNTTQIATTAFVLANASGGTTSPLTTKGDIYGYSTTNARIPVGANDQVLTADSTAALGVAWKNGGGAGTVYYNQIASSQANLTNSYRSALTGSVNGTNTAFTVAGSVYIAGTLQVFLNGVLQVPGEAITETTPNSGIFTFITAPPSNSQILATYQTQSSGSGVGSVNLDSLTDVVITTPNNGQSLVYNGTSWVNSSSGVGVTDGDKGDVTVTGGGSTWTIDAGVIANSRLAAVPNGTLKGRLTTGVGAIEDLTSAQATGMLNQFTSASNGLTPASGGGTSTYLRADGTWAAPPGGSGGTSDLGFAPSISLLSYNANSSLARTAWYGIFTSNISGIATKAVVYAPYVQTGSIIQIGIYSVETGNVLGSGTVTTTSTAGFITVTFSAAITLVAGAAYYYALLNKTNEGTTQFLGVSNSNLITLTSNTTDTTSLPASFPTTGRNPTNLTYYIQLI